MPSIFISYRRSDSSGYAGRIHERLVHLYGTESVFMDLEDITPGVNFADMIEDQVAAAQTLLVLIGPEWLQRDSNGRRRIDDANDFVRLEVARALSRNVRVIPVLLDGARMPREAELPDELRGLSRIHAASLSGARWDYDFEQLTRAIQGRRPAIRSHHVVLVATVALVLSLVAGALWMWPVQTNVTGEWQGIAPYDFGPAQMETFVFQQSGSQVSGAASFLGLARPIVEGTIEGDQLLFTTKTSEDFGENRRLITHHYSGEVDGAEIKLTLQTEGSTSFHPPVLFTLKRVR